MYVGGSSPSTGCLKDPGNVAHRSEPKTLRMTPHYKSYHNLINSGIRTSRRGGGGMPQLLLCIAVSVTWWWNMWYSLWFQRARTHQTHMNIGVFLGVSCFIFEHNKDGLDTTIKAASEHRMTARVLDNQNHTVCISQSAVVLRLLLFLYSFYS
jgi:hypothetical protein